MTSSSGYITQFNEETNVGYIETQAEDETNKRCLKFHVYSLKKNAKRYITKENVTFVGELFDFDIIQHTDGTEDEAINIRHRILMCPIQGCPRLKAFINRKVLDEHIQSKHCQVKKIVEISSSEVVPPKLQKKTGMSIAMHHSWQYSSSLCILVKKPEAFTVKLMTKSAAVIGRFIGKSGVNLKEFQKTNNVFLKILTQTTQLSLAQNPTVEIRLKPLKINVNVAEVSRKLKSLWEKAVREQTQEEYRFQQSRINRASRVFTFGRLRDINFDNDTRRMRAFTISGDEMVRRRSPRYGQTEATLRKRQARSTLSLEGHRCAATGDLQQGGTKLAHFHPRKKISMKDKQWLVKEQLDEEYW
ncbi:hypothetical protein I4U23_015541 [Adineta vaga]|nr:hypothetical protein I4U23_015541 [Adineta vaga]